MKKALIIVAALFVVLLLWGALVVYYRPIAVISAMRRRDLVKHGFVKSTVNSPSGAQTMFAAGSGPTLIFLHGAGDEAGTWKDVAPRFLANYHVVLVDLAGHGQSAPTAGPLKIQTMLDGLDSVVVHESQPVILVGNSLGAWLAMVYASQHAGRVTRVIAVDGGPIRGERVDLAKLPANREEARKIWDAILDPGSPRLPNFVLDDVVRQSHRGAMGRMQMDDMQQSIVPDESLQSFPVPVDIIWGEADRLVPMEYADRMTGALPAVRLSTLPRCGHIPQGECPTAFSRALTQVLDSPPPAPRPAAPVKTAAEKER